MFKNTFQSGFLSILYSIGCVLSDGAITAAAVSLRFCAPGGAQRAAWCAVARACAVTRACGHVHALTFARVHPPVCNIGACAQTQEQAAPDLG